MMLKVCIETHDAPIVNMVVNMIFLLHLIAPETHLTEEIKNG